MATRDEDAPVGQQGRGVERARGRQAPVADEVPVAGSKISALSCDVSKNWPPTIRTVPFASSVMVRPLPRFVVRVPATLKVPLAGSYRSTEFSEATSTLPSGRVTAG